MRIELLHWEGCPSTPEARELLEQVLAERGLEATVEVQRDFGGQGVRIVAVNSNDADSHPEDSFDEMRARAQREGSNFDYLYDEPQAIARELGSERTPEVFVFDRDRRLRYHGAIDDSRD